MGEEASAGAHTDPPEPVVVRTTLPHVGVARLQIGDPMGGSRLPDRLGGSRLQATFSLRPPLGHGVVGGGLGGTPLAARPPASGHWHRGMDLQESSAAQVPQVRAS